MKKFFVSVFVVLTTIMTISAQQNSLKPNLLVQEAKKINKSLPVQLFSISKTRNDVNIPKEIESFSILDIDQEGLKKFRKEKSNFISLTIPQEGRSDLTLELVEVQPFAEGFTVKTAPSMQTVEVNSGKHYRGIIKGQERSIAAISIFDDQIMGFISHPSATGNLVIGKLENSPEHILYQDDQISEKFNFDCQAKDKETEYTTDQLNGNNTGSRALSDCVRLYLEVDYDIYVNKGSTTTAVTNYVTGIFNQVSTLYANEQINTVVSEIVIWTQQSPYNSTSSINMLNAFTANRQGFNGDLAQLLSYKASGGVAYVDGLCRSNPDYSMGYAGIQSSYSNVPTYSWTVEVCAHEFGHLFGSQHTHACVWNGNNTAIDGCYTTEGGCANPGNPPATVGGTIMSYCHLTSSGINFSNGFGVQPGNVIRSEVTTATCLQACSGGGGGGGGNQCTENVLSLEIRTDNYPTETTWNIKNSAGAILYSGGPYNTPNTLNTISLCLPSACYTFNIIDGYGDGICCTYGSGYYSIKQGTTTLITGGQFGATETKSFCASGTSSNLTLSTSAAAVSSAAGNATVGVTSNISWTATSNATTWCTVTPASGSNNGNLTVSYAANSTTSARTATITVSGSGINRTYVLTQSGNTPELTLSAATATATSGAGSNTVGVTSNISWTAISNATTWCTVTPASGSNNGNLAVSYTANTSTSARTATITVSGSGINRTYVLTQSGNTPELTLSAATATVTSAAGSNSVGVTSNISWTAISNATTWCTVAPASGSNNGNLAVSYTANTSTSARTATITVSGSGINRTYVLTQSGNTPELTLSAATATVTSAAGSNSVGVTSNISWTAISNATTWCTVTPASGSNNGNLAVSYTANTSTSARTATITVSGSGINRTYVLTQSGNTPELTLSAATATASSAAGNNTVGVTSNISWTAISNATTWCTVSPANGSNNGNLAVSYTANTSTSARTATITVSGSGINRTYVLTQSGNTPELTLSAATATATSGAGSNTVGVTSNISWTAISNATTWCTVTPASGSNNGNLAVSYTANTSTSARTATINVSGSGINRTYVLTQSGVQGPSCTDGVQNGQETGIDCGGPTCPACPPNNDVQITTLAGHYFETGWDGWTDGGVDCARVNTSSSPEGSFSIQLRDNDGEFSSMTSPVYNISQFDSVTVEFKFRSTSFETNEDFWLMYYNGTTWNNISAFTFPANFANNVTYTRKVKINGPLSSTGRFRFQADASDNTDVVYIDAVIIIGYKTNTQATCTDGVKNGQETGVDCGGPTCPSCPPTCTDGVRNGQETGIDCGGPTCPSCPPTCTDGVKNGQETGVDCGGPTCPSCPPTCTDGIQNGQETGVDCGGPTCPSCLPTCTDGVKNGQETGVDCGGPTCPSCPPSCTDGVKNGQETGVDCGGPTCPVCLPTCTDGIQNGQETGVDCGGPCPACNTGGSVTTISGHYFETGWDSWIDGGSDCYRYDGPLSPEGTYSIRLRDNSEEQSGMSSPNYNLTPYNTVQIEFKFRTNGMEAGEDFWLMYFNGSIWTNIGTFVSGAGFNNNQLYTATVTITGTFSSASKFRFQCDASENDDEVYIDAVVIRAGTGSGSFENPIVITAENNTVEAENMVSGVQIFPNPATDMINVQSDEDVRRVNIYNIAGQLVLNITSDNIETVDISRLNSGLYIIKIETEENVFTERLIKN